MPSGPTRFDDSGESDGADRSTGSTSYDASTDRAEPRRPARPDESSSARREPHQEPNYLVRRAIVVGGVVAVLATASVVIGQLMGTGGDANSSGAVRAEWNRVVVLDERTGRVTVIDGDGDEVGHVETQVDSVTGSDVVENSMLISSPDRVAVIDLARADDEPAADEPNDTTDSTDDSGNTDEPETDGATTTFAFGADSVVTPAGSALTMIAPRADAGRAVLLHGPSGKVIDTDSFVPVVGARYEFATSRAAPSGRHVLVTDSANFQSVLFSFDRDEPSYFPGLALAVDDDLVVTAQNVGANANIAVFDHAGEELATASTGSVRTGMVAGDRVVLVTVDGAIVTMDTSTGDTADGEKLEIGTVAVGYVTPNGDRLVALGEAGATVINDDGTSIGTYTNVRLADEGAPRGSTCIALLPLDPDPEPQLRVVDTVDGSSVVDTITASVTAEGSERAPLHADASGCTLAIGATAGFDLVTSEGAERIPTGDVLVGLAPDASKVVVERSGRVLLLELRTDEDEPAPPIDLGRAGAVVHFTRS